MTDMVTKKPIEVDVSDGGYAGLLLPYEQLDQLRALFDANKIEYWVEDEVLSVNDGPETAFVELSRRSDPQVVQRLLDSVP